METVIAGKKHVLAPIHEVGLVNGGEGGCPLTTNDLLPSERVFVEAMHRLAYGRFEGVRIEHGELVLDPWPSTIRQIRFGAADPGNEQKEPSAEFRLKRQVAELFEHVRSFGSGEIRTLEIRNGLPFAMQIGLERSDCRSAVQGDAIPVVKGNFNEVVTR
jgi:hypothetical protein